jgi:Cu+-exporting ATPase
VPNGSSVSNSAKITIRDEDIQCIDVDLLQKGDVVRILPGDRIPTDGKVLFGHSYVDESMITGESIPIHKKFNDLLFGSTVNQGGTIYMVVTTYGSESALSQIVRLVEVAQMNKAPVQDYADKLAGIFTPVILILAAVTFFTWLTLSEMEIVPSSWFKDEYNDPVLFSLLFSISVVVISCPCALGLATPTAIMVGTTVGAKHGILIKGGSAFEMAHK